MHEVFRLGNCRFTMDFENRELADTMRSLFPRCEADSHDVIPLRVADANSVDAFRSVVAAALEYHHGLLWLDGAVAVSKDLRRQIILSGSSQSGKTTLSLALQVAGWFIIADDIVLVDAKKNQVVSFLAPFHLRPGTSELIRDETGHSVKLVDGEFVVKDFSAPDVVPFEFEKFILLKDRPGGNELEVRPVAGQTLVRELLSLSNVLRLEGGIDFLAARLSEQCCVVRNGTLASRVDLLVQE